MKLFFLFLFFPTLPKTYDFPSLPHHIPLMVISYIGALKTLLYWPIFRILGANPWTLRLPVVLVGAITIFFFVHLASVSGGARAAAIGAFLLATDPVFLLTNTFDWGPVALEHVFLVTGCWLVYRFGHKSGSDARIWNLAAGFFCWGLALWNKAIFVWALSGVVAGGVLVFLAGNQALLEPARRAGRRDCVSLRRAAAGGLQPHAPERNGNGERAPGPAQRRRQMDPGRRCRERFFAVRLHDGRGLVAESQGPAVSAWTRRSVDLTIIRATTGTPAFTTSSASCCWRRHGGGNTAQPDFHWSS